MKPGGRMWYDVSGKNTLNADLDHGADPRYFSITFIFQSENNSLILVKTIWDFEVMILMCLQFGADPNTNLDLVNLNVVVS